MNWLFLGNALGSTQLWTSYAVGVAATAVSMPVTYKSAQALAGRSNKLILGALPSAVIGITIPATAAWAGTHFMTNRESIYPHTPWKNWGTMVGLNTMLWASGAAFGVNSKETKHAAFYGLLTSLVVPLPCLKKNSSVSPSPVQSPLSSESFTVQGIYYGSF